jgi:hypothetical protein
MARKLWERIFRMQERSGGFWTLRNGEQGSASGRVRCAGLHLATSRGSRFALMRGLGGCGFAQSFPFFHTKDALVRNFPAKILALAVLLEMLFEENGAAGIGDECSGGRKANVSGAILNIYKTAKKRGVTGHRASFLTDSSIVNSTNG